MKVVFILGSGHSGTTLLDLLLSQHPDAIGLGEVLRFMKGHKKNYEHTCDVCSCGTSLSQCNFWSALVSLEGSGRDDTTMQQAYRKIFAHAALQGAHIVIDSSKHTDGVRVLSGLAQAGVIELYVVFLTRDVRGWVYSAQDSARRSGMIPRPACLLIPRWYREQQKMLEAAKKYTPSFTQLSYEELCREPAAVLTRLLQTVQLSQFDFEHATTARTHIMMGNRMKMNLKFPIQVSCDEKWKKKPWLRYCLYFFPRIAQWNKTKNPTS